LDPNLPEQLAQQKGGARRALRKKRPKLLTAGLDPIERGKPQLGRGAAQLGELCLQERNRALGLREPLTDRRTAVALGHELDEVVTLTALATKLTLLDTNRLGNVRMKRLELALDLPVHVVNGSRVVKTPLHGAKDDGLGNQP